MPNCFETLLTLEDEITYTKKHPTASSQDEIPELTLLQAGYGFDDDVTASLNLTDQLETELGEDDSAPSKRSADIIKSTGILQQASSKEVLCINLGSFVPFEPFVLLLWADVGGKLYMYSY